MGALGANPSLALHKREEKSLLPSLLIPLLLSLLLLFPL